MKRMPWWVWVGVLVLIGWSAASGPGDTDPSAGVPEKSPGYSEPAAGPPNAPMDRPERDRSGHRHDRDARHPSGPGPRPSPTPDRHARHTFQVVHVVDGDTLDLGNGERVRLVGIDTPEVGECGYDAAAAALSRMVLDRQVRLATSDEERDRYDRLLRYVDVGRTDAGLALIRKGLAIARYDSRDGYGFHPREPAYVAADRGTRPVCARPVPLAAPVKPAPAKNCAPGYSPCVPPGPPDLDCADVSGPVRVTGSDPHRLDGDGDGVACE